MKHYLLLLLLLLPGMSRSQGSTDTIFYNAAWKPCSRDSALYFRTGTVFRNGLYSVTDYHRNGKVQMKGAFRSFDPDKREGKFLYFDSLGRLQMEEQYVNNKAHGTWTFYRADGWKSAERRFREGKQNGMALFYDSLGLVTAKEPFVNGRIEGEATYYFPHSTRIRKKLNYRNGYLEGRCYLLDSASQRVIWEWQSKKDVTVGTGKQYSIGGKLMRTLVHKDTLNAVLSYYDTTSGKVTTSGALFRSKRQGLWVQNTASGKRMAEAGYDAGRLHGTYLLYDTSCGNVVNSGQYEHGNRVGTWKLYKPCDTGLYISSEYVKGKKHGPFRVYDTQTGFVLREGADSAGRETGLWTYYFKGSRNVRMERPYRRGKLHGELRTYFENGSIRRRELYENGVIMKWNCYSSTGADTLYYKRFEDVSYPDEPQDYFRHQIVYPEQALLASLNGKVQVRLYVDEGGRIYDADIMASSNVIFNEEAQRVARNLPIFAPATDEGTPVASEIIVIVSFSAEEALPLGSDS